MKNKMLALSYKKLCEYHKICSCCTALRLLETEIFRIFFCSNHTALIHKNIMSVRNSYAINQSDIKHIMTSLIRTITSILTASTDIITARPVGVAEI